MTPEERNLVAQLFDRLETLENAPRDPDAEKLIRDGQQQAPNAPYALVQTVLVQDEALKRADARIRDLESQLGVSGQTAQQGGFLDSMRNNLFGRRDTGRGSVPAVPAGQAGAPAQGQAFGQGQGQSGSFLGGGGSFLGTAAAAAAGVIGGSLLLSGIRSMMGYGGHYGAFDSGYGTGLASPWSGGGGGDLARQAGLDDIGRGQGRSAGLFDSDDRDDRTAGLIDTAENEAGDDSDVDDEVDAGSDDTDYA